MQEGAKKRLAGAVVIVALAVIFVPMLFEDASLVPPQVQGALPSEPDFEDPFVSEASLPLDPEPEDTGDLGLVAEAEPLDPADPPPMESGFDDSEDDLIGEPGQLGGTPPSVAPPVSGAQPDRPRSAASPDVARPAPTPAPKPAQQPPRKETAAEPRPRDDGMPSWVVQVSSLGSSEAADALVGKLKKAGFSAFVEKAQVNGKTYYRVRVGPDVDRANAERTAAMLRQKQKLDTLIQRYP